MIPLPSVFERVNNTKGPDSHRLRCTQIAVTFFSRKYYFFLSVPFCGWIFEYMRNARVHILKVGEITKTKKKYAELLFKTLRNTIDIEARMDRK